MPDTRKGSIKSNESDSVSFLNETLQNGLKNIESRFDQMKTELKDEMSGVIREAVREVAFTCHEFSGR